ncbi:Aste57867_9524 [Aphanomyces stellatus]|uniref:Aste57867_9524 protein n=1 Tax=Aphanomyces stellatus TaxID=120398 RepID=A0A485KNF0_9STRA|nr:hypothetical protein As57867_009487 [Aphanomyces stellatus]VFT86403.1 Aste57867_9524 [Aphanomyces stellatus]
MFRRLILAGVCALALFTTSTVAQVPVTTTLAPTAAPVPVNALFPLAATACQRCANNPLPNSPDCLQAFKGVPGKYCHKWLSGGVQQACCCPTAAICPAQSLKQDTCACDTPGMPNKAPVVVVKPRIAWWVWLLVAIGTCLLIVALWYFCCRNSNMCADDPVYVEQPVMYVQQQYPGQPVVAGQPGYVVGQPGYVVAGQPGYMYGQPGYYDNGAGVAAGVAIGATAGLVGGVALGAAMGGGMHGGYGGGYGADMSAGGGGGGDFGGDF